MQKYSVTGMSCAACSSRIERAVSKLSGVESCAVSLLTNTMSVEGTAAAQSVVRAVRKAGYGAAPIGEGAATQGEASLGSGEVSSLKGRLASSLVFLVVLLYFSMGHMMWGWPLPAWFEGNHVAMGLVQLLLSLAVLFINRKFFTSGVASALHGSCNMDTLVSLGAGVSFAYSVVVLFLMTDAVVKGDEARVVECMDNFYFEGAAMIVSLISVGKMLEALSKGKTTDALKDLMKLSPQTATLVKDGSEVVVPIDQVAVGDTFAVKPGEAIPVDGVVVEGASAVNEAALTGESIPSDKEAGSKVYSATVNTSGYLLCRATRVGEDTTLSQIIRLVSDAAATKAPIARIADRVSAVFVPTVIAIAAVTLVVWLLVGAAAGFALSRAIAVLVISCPCALGLATPVAIMVASGVAARRGILFKTAASIEEAGRVKVVALDKTGTLTKGEPEVTDVVPLGIDEEELVRVAAAVEVKSEHPLARAVVDYWHQHGTGELAEAEGFTALPGQGAQALVAGQRVVAASLKYTAGLVDVSTVEGVAARLCEEGKTPLAFVRGGKLVGLIAVADAIKEESPRAVEELVALGVTPVMITGDSERTARAIARQCGIQQVVAGVLPGQKADVVQRLKSSGKCAMVGDGINDAPALASADVAIAIGAGSDIAIESASIVLVKSSPLDIPAVIRLSRAALVNIKENLFWAFFYNVLGIPLAAGVYYHALGWSLNPMFAAAAMSLSSFCVVSNALRLNLFDPYKVGKKHRAKTRCNTIDLDNKETKMDTLEKVIKVQGMMCSHCEAHVKEALEKIKGVDEATASHEKGEVVLKLSREVDMDKIADAVKKAGYAVV